MSIFPVTVLVLFSLLAACQCLPWRKDKEKDKCKRYIDVAIVGAGPSGTYSAYRLRDEGLNIEVFEYSDRVGGRLYTSTLPDEQDVNIELGGMRFVAEVHSIVKRLVDELGLTPLPFVGKTDSRFYLRGGSYSTEDLRSGNIPYNLSAEEYVNRNRIFNYYLWKLTGFNESSVNETVLMHLKLQDGRFLYTVPIDESLDIVATKEGKEYMMAIGLFESIFANDTSVSFLEANIGAYHGDYPVLTLKEGMSSIPQGLIKVFLTASPRHRLNMNRQLLSISSKDAIGYRLVFQHTKTANNITTATDTREVVCAKKVILGLPRLALSEIKWSALRDDRVREAIDAVRDVKAIKMFISFPTRWWMDNATNPAQVTYSDLSFSSFYDWGRSNATGHYIMLASYADESRAKFLGKLNVGGTHFNGSPFGSHAVNEKVIYTVLNDLAKAYGTDRVHIPEPISAVIQFWGNYPFGGGWVVWKYGYRYDDVISTIQRPSLRDDVFYVGADHCKGFQTGWSEGAYDAVDRVIDNYFN